MHLTYDAHPGNIRVSILLRSQGISDSELQLYNLQTVTVILTLISSINLRKVCTDKVPDKIA